MFYYLQGTADTIEERILQESDRRVIAREECGVSGAIGTNNPSFDNYVMLTKMILRGYDGAGIVSLHDDRMYRRREVGRVDDVFKNFDFSNLPGNVAIGHNRYSTDGDGVAPFNVQPFTLAETAYGKLATAHNGTIPHAASIKEKLRGKYKTAFGCDVDSELALHSIHYSEEPDLDKAIVYMANHLKLAFCMTIMTNDTLYALRDVHGTHPLSYARKDDGWIVASENWFMGDDYVEVKPGTLVKFELGKEPQIICVGKGRAGKCAMSNLYLEHPGTRNHGIFNEDFREELGKQVYRENKEFFEEEYWDYIVPIPDSGKDAAKGLSEMTGVPYREFFRKNLDVRSFILREGERKKTVKDKLFLRKDKCRGKRILFVDDSIVRSTTSTQVVEYAKEAGTEKIGLVSAAPPITNVCHLGMDYRDKSKLIASANSIDEICQIIKTDVLLYLSESGYKKVMGRMYGTSGLHNSGACTGCFGGWYPGIEGLDV